MDEMKVLAQNLIVTGLGLFAMFTIGIVVVTYVQELVRTRMRNGKGNVRNGDKSWTAQLLTQTGAMSEKLSNIERVLTNDFQHKFDEITEKLDSLKK